MALYAASAGNRKVLNAENGTMWRCGAALYLLLRANLTFKISADCDGSGKCCLLTMTVDSFRDGDSSFQEKKPDDGCKFHQSKGGGVGIYGHHKKSW